MLRIRAIKSILSLGVTYWRSPLEHKSQYALVDHGVYHYFFCPLFDNIIHYFVALISKGLLKSVKKVNEGMLIERAHYYSILAEGVRTIREVVWYFKRLHTLATMRCTAAEFRAPVRAKTQLKLWYSCNTTIISSDLWITQTRSSRFSDSTINLAM